MIADANAMLKIMSDEHVNTRDNIISHRLSGLPLRIPGRQVKRADYHVMTNAGQQLPV
jgi:hypothetical protein